MSCFYPKSKKERALLEATEAHRTQSEAGAEADPGSQLSVLPLHLRLDCPLF